MKLFNIEKQIKNLNKQILFKENEVLVLEEQKREPYLAMKDMIDDNIDRINGELRILKQKREQLLEERKEGFLNKVLWSIVVPIIISITTTIITITISTILK